MFQCGPANVTHKLESRSCTEAWAVIAHALSFLFDVLARGLLTHEGHVFLLLDIGVLNLSLLNETR